MEKFTTLTGIAAPLPMINVDTDMIIPKQYLKTIKRTGLGTGLFAELRYDEEGKPHPHFVLHKPPYTEATILITGENFGCGSSRESAVWAMAGFGFRCVIAPGFGDIFYNNAFQNGMLLIRLPKEQVERLAAELETGATPSMRIDLQKQVITAPSGAETPFEIDAERRQALLEGRDEIAMTLARDTDIRTFQERDRAARPWIYETSPRNEPAA